MLDWIQANKEWIFSGCGVAILGGLLTYLFRKKIGGAPASQVVVRIEGVQHIANEDQGLVSLVPIQRIAPITPSDINEAIRKAVPLQADSVKKSFEGLKVEWDTVLNGAKERDGDVNLFLDAPFNSLFGILCSVKYADYRELGVLPKGSLIRVYGEIESADAWSVSLRNVELRYMAPRKDA